MTANPNFRPEPRKGVVLRFPLDDGFFGYGAKVNSVAIWIFNFVTREPACGSDFFSPNDRLFAALLSDLTAEVKDCGRIQLTPNEYDGHSWSEPLFYERLKKAHRVALGFEFDTAVYDHKNRRYRELRPEDAKREMRHEKQWVTWTTYQKIFSSCRGEMIVRSVPDQNIDRAALDMGAPSKCPPQEVELLILMPQAELRTDDPEPDLEEPLAGYLTEFECGEVTGSGTTPGFFEINVETTQEDLTRCLNLTRRTLKHLKAPASTIIRVLSDPPVDHPLNPNKKTTGRAPASKEVRKPVKRRR